MRCDTRNPCPSVGGAHYSYRERVTPEPQADALFANRNSVSARPYGLSTYRDRLSRIAVQKCSAMPIAVSRRLMDIPYSTQDSQC